MGTKEGLRDGREGERGGQEEPPIGKNLEAFHLYLGNGRNLMTDGGATLR